MRLASRDPLLRVIRPEVFEEAERETVPRPAIPYAETGRGKTYDYEAVSDELKAWVHQENVVKGRSINNLAKELGIHQSRFRVGLRLIGCKFEVSHLYSRTDSAKTPANCLQALRLRESGLSFSQVAEELKISPSTARTWAEEAISIRLKAR